MKEFTEKSTGSVFDGVVNKHFLGGERLFLFTWLIVMAVVNFPLLFGEVRSQLVFFPDSVLLGKWWQIVSHPFVHLSWYHLVLDGLAFLLLYLLLEEKRALVRIFYSIAAGGGALLLALFLEPSIYAYGLCGLSGVAHGLMAISAFEMTRQSRQRKVGVCIFVGVIAKCIYELLTGNVLLETLHLGQTGQPLPASHAGGVIGGLSALFLKMKISPETR